MAPYLIALAVLAGLGRSSRMPASIGRRCPWESMRSTWRKPSPTLAAALRAGRLTSRALVERSPRAHRRARRPLQQFRRARRGRRAGRRARQSDARFARGRAALGARGRADLDQGQHPRRRLALDLGQPGACRLRACDRRIAGRAAARRRRDRDRQDQRARNSRSKATPATISSA